MTADATAIYHTLYPAGVHFPDGIVRTRCKVFAAPEGLCVYWAVAPDDRPDWFSPIDFGLTTRPRTGYAARNGWDVYTADGIVTVTAEGGCGCGWPLKRWTPQFARTRLAWPVKGVNSR